MKDSFTFAGLGLTQLPTQLKCSQNAPDGTYGSLATKASKHIKVGCILRGMVLPVQYNWQPKFQRYLQNNHSEHRWKFEWTVEDAWSMPYSFDLLACAIFQTSFVPTSSYPALLACQYCQIMGKNTTHHSLPHFTFPKKPWSFPQIPRKVVQTSGFLSQQSLGTIFCILPKTPKTFNLGKKISIATPPSFAIFFCGCDRHGNACPQLASSCWHHTSSLGMIFPLIFGQICAAKEMEKSPRRCTWSAMEIKKTSYPSCPILKWNLL